ncbi:MAG TPA: lipopolysaccharide biosynthesis protein [Pyrinomonadaceae bacterium]|nr:lipopolysaccharide biosynthesis protein [Pyrinomonadaceae bacterium]
MPEKRPASSESASLTKPAFLIMIAKSISFAFSFVLPLLLVRSLNQEEFGLYKQIFLVVGTAIVVLPLGVGMSAFYFLPRERERKGHVVFNIMLFNVVVSGLACVALFVRPAILGSLFNSTQLIPYASLIGIVILFWTVSSFFELVAIANQEPGVATVFIVAAQITKTSLLVAAAVFFDSLEYLIWAAAIQGILQTIALLVYLWSRFPGFWRDFSWSMLTTQMSYALPIGFAAALYSLQTDLHNYFVANSFGPASFAIYAIGCFQLPLIGILSESVGAVMIPRVSSLQQEDNRREIVLITAQVMRKLAAIYFPVYVFLFLTAREFLTFLFTAAYLSSWPIFLVNLSLVPIGILVTDPILRAYAEQRYFLLRVKIAIFILLFGVLWFGILHLGLVGAIAVAVGASIFERLIAASRAARVLKIGWGERSLFSDIGKLAVAAIAAGALTAIVYAFLPEVRPLVVLCICGVVFSVCYAVAVWVLRIPTEEERAYARRLIERVLRGPWKRLHPTAS